MELWDCHNHRWTGNKCRRGVDNMTEVSVAISTGGCAIYYKYIVAIKHREKE
ncbi:MAG: hypothetical protein J7K81_10270 [Methanophagales archaeon]|nr:hypothetical protein [Methanophagales archaeon]